MRKLLRRSLNNSWSLKEHIALWRRNYKCLFQLQEWKREKKKKKKKKEGKGQSAVLGVVDISPLMGNSTHARQNDAAGLWYQGRERPSWTKFVEIKKRWEMINIQEFGILKISFLIKL